jgi:hypothetical protein
VVSRVTSAAAEGYEAPKANSLRRECSEKNEGSTTNSPLEEFTADPEPTSEPKGRRVFAAPIPGPEAPAPSVC